MPIRIKVHLGTLLCSICVLAICLAKGAVAGTIEDPQQSCEGLAQAIGEADADKLSDRIAADSRGGMNQSAANAAQQIVSFSKERGGFLLTEFMAKHELGNRFRRYWYLVLFEDSETLYLYCEYLKPDDRWQLLNIKFNTDFEDLPPP